MQKIFSYIFPFCIFTLVFVMFFHPVSAITQDLGLHIKTGEIILFTHNVPKTNLFSYTYSGFPFINHHWLSEVIFYLIYQLSGFSGLLIIVTFTAAIAFFLVFIPAFKKADISAIAIASILYLEILAERTDLRPEIFSFLFLSIFIAVLYKFRQKFTRWIFILPIIELFWVNIHIYFIVGIAVIGLFFVDALFQNRKRLRCRYIGIFAVTIFLSLLSTLINPNFINGALYPFKVFQNYGYTIEENQNIFFIWNYFHKTTTLYFFISVIALFTVLLINLKKSRIIDWLLAVSFSALAFSAERNTALFVFATFTTFAVNLSSVLQKLNLKKVRNYILLGSLLLLFFQFKSNIKQRGFGTGIEKGARDAADFFLKENIKGPIFNNFDIGSYLDYRFYPKIKTFVDARPEAYPVEFFQKIYIPMQENPKIFREVSQKYKFNSIFFAYTDQTPWAQTFLAKIIQNPDWQPVYLDDYAIILVKNTSQNRDLISRFKITQKTEDISRFAQNTNSLIKLAYLFNLVGWRQQEILAYEHLTALDPYNCSFLYNLYFMQYSANDPLYNIYLTKFRFLGCNLPK